MAGTPFLLDAWTGEIMPLAVYQSNGSSTTVPVTISGNSSAIYGFGKVLSAINVPSRYVESTDVSFPTVENGRIILRETQNATRHFLADGEDADTVNFTVPAAVILTNWNVTITPFNPPDDIHEADPLYSSV